jgi:hypothetical protein
MNSKGLLFIPDISGFTRFVTETEISHSRLIIQELLELIINANQIQLEISEIEGDAVLFYKFGEPPSLQELYKQVEKMFCAFHKNLVAYDQRKYCLCKACTSAAELSLKVITHYGEFAEYNIKNFSKLIGKDVIVAHQLLKNDIEQHEYWLITKDLLHDDKLPRDFAAWMKWDGSMKKTEAGEIHYLYTTLSELKKELPEDPLPLVNLSGKIKVCSVSREYDTDIITLFHAAGAFEYRARWWEGVKKVEELSHYLPRVGMKSRFTLDNNETILVLSNYYTNSDAQIEFSETDEKGSQLTKFTLVKKEDKKTLLTIDVYKTGNWFTKFRKGLLNEKAMEAKLQKSLENITQLFPEIKI